MYELKDNMKHIPNILKDKSLNNFILIYATAIKINK